MKLVSTITLIFLLQFGYAQVVLDADGPGNTYELITSILAPGQNPIEAPDCNHSEFGEHIDEFFDSELNTHVFRFFIHTTPDDDRCINFDRQRNEIKTYGPSPINLLGTEGEKVVYKWKFKLEDGFQSSPNFTHIHQLKSVGGSLASMPMYTLTTRKGSPDRLELRYAETSSQITLTQTPLEPFIGSWLSVTETIEYGVEGTYEIEIRKVEDDSILLTHSESSIINWRPNADFVRPKWGIYRSLINAQDLRDETVLFANFSIEEIDIVSSEQSYKDYDSQITFTNPVFNSLEIRDLSRKVELIRVFGLDGRLILERNVDSKASLDIDVSSLPRGIYILNFAGKKLNQSQLVHIL